MIKCIVFRTNVEEHMAEFHRMSRNLAKFFAKQNKTYLQFPISTFFRGAPTMDRASTILWLSLPTDGEAGSTKFLSSLLGLRITLTREETGTANPGGLD